jgi:hypothetical protein
MNLSPIALRIILFLVAGACALAATRMPYAYDKLIRFVVVIASIGVIPLIWDRVKNESLKTIACASFIILAIVFNPLIPFRLHRDSWATWDAGASLLFACGALLLPPKKDTNL